MEAFHLHLTARELLHHCALGFHLALTLTFLDWTRLIHNVGCTLDYMMRFQSIMTITMDFPKPVVHQDTHLLCVAGLLLTVC